MIRTLVVSNLRLLREAVCLVLSIEDDLEAVSAFGTDREVLSRAVHLAAHVAVVDLGVTHRDELRTVRLLVKSLPQLAVVALSAEHTPGALRRALVAGVRGFASRAQAPGELAEIIRRVARGELVLHQPTALATLAVMDNPLSERQQEALRLAGRGMPTKEIAERLFLAEGTVRNYLSDAMRKLDCPNRLRAARRAEEAGWL
ncbi:two-component system response regulator DesR [Actinoplanes xinjiangensis]|uniref:Two-component system response regulator DesR n=1 Tax=Actinoplanes xinjiangensis TaxID=512350 RepID=A0A316FXY8_9ACTN|nr:two-component system response regulator DesR [Actinoplanes xinjiangensis]GIF40095.1 DNA-binding response regulator [Actinoplanes xinjiangensis]